MTLPSTHSPIPPSTPLPPSRDDSPAATRAIVYSVARSRRSARGPWRNLLTLACMGIAGGGYYYLDQPRPVPMAAAPPPAPTIKPVVIAPPPAAPLPRGEAPEKVYREQIVPLLVEFDRRNAAAAGHAIARLHESMAQHRAGVKPFASDLTRIGTRFGVMKRYSSDTWHRVMSSDNRGSAVKQYVNDKFRDHVLSEQKLKDDVAGALAQFDEEMAASRNRLYADLSLPLSRVKVASPALDDGYAAFRKLLEQRSAEMSGALGRDTLVGGMAELAGAWVATDVAQSIATRVVGQVLGQLGASMAVEGVEAGGATVAGATAGGGTGSLGGPAGTIIGLGVGLAVGIVVDYWISERFEARIVQQCDGFLAVIERNLVSGVAQKPGLRQALGDTVNLVGKTQRQAIWKTLVGSESVAMNR